MKNPYPKGKPNIHPSPSPLSLLNLLPAAILALVAAMNCDDREVLAYLLLRSAKTPSSVLQEKRKCRKLGAADAPAAALRPLLDCPCFECYTRFWTRWDSSPNRELIHRAIEAFEEELARGESAKRGRRKERRAGAKSAREGEVGGGAAADPAMEDDKVEEASEVVVTAAAEEEEVVVTEAATSTSTSRKGWPDVMGMFNSRLWGLWNPTM